MSAVVIDTCVWIDYLAGRASELEIQIEEALLEGRVYLSPIVITELFSAKNFRQGQEKALFLLLNEIPLAVCGIQHWISVGKLRGALRRRGLTVSTPDAHIVQVALDLNARLLSHDLIFQKIKQIVPRLNLN